MLGLLSYDTLNLGDDIQSVATRALMPDKCEPVRIMRDYLSLYSGPPVLMVLNGWWLHKTGNWPPAPAIRPLLTSFHVDRGAVQAVVTEHPEYLVRHGPVGCRDTNTLHTMTAHGIPCGLSRCMTMTLARRDTPRKGVVWCDVGRYSTFGDRTTQEGLKESVLGQASVTMHTHCLEATRPSQERDDMANRSLDLLASAEMVVTSRLHVAMPCVAMGTPVLFVIDDGPSRAMDRFGGMLGCFDCVTGIHRFHGMARNPHVPQFQEWADSLRQQVRSFLSTVP